MPTQAQVRHIFNYDADAGVLTWVASPAYHIKDGTIAGSVYRDGYRRIRAFGKSHAAHRLVWLFVHGDWPTTLIDHINGNRDDNRISNLREATPSENNQNLRVSRSGKKTKCPLGVTMHSQTGKWQAQIKSYGQSIYLGLYDTPELAHLAYLEAKEVHHPFGEISRKHERNP